MRNRKARLAWIAEHILVPLAVSLLAAWLAYTWLKDDARSIIDKSLSVIGFDSAIDELARTAQYTVNQAQFRRASQADPNAGLQAQKAQIDRLERSTGEAVDALEKLLAVYDRLPVDDRPAKLYGDELIPSPKRRFREDIDSLRAKLAAIRGTATQMSAQVEMVRSSIGQMREDEFGFLTAQMSQISAQVESARRLLMERRDALREALAAFAKQ
jgi:hypothetical protein